MRAKSAFLAAVTVALASAAAWAQRVTELAGRVDEVTVYRGQALVTRVLDLPADAGLHEIVVTELPPAVVASSLYADAATGVAVRSIRYRERPVQRDVRAEVQAIDDRIAGTQRDQRANEQAGRRLAEERAYLARLEQFGGDTAMTELRSGVLDADTIKSLSGYVFTERERISVGELAQQERAMELQASLDQLQRERAQLAGTTARTVREAVLFCEIVQAGARQIRLRYLVDQATWTPSYTVRTDESHTGVTVEYYAAIQQLSGEDWGDVAMTLSTASASLVAKAPELTPLRVELAGVPRPSGDDARQMHEVYSSRKAEVAIQRLQAGTFTGTAQTATRDQFDSELNDLAANIWLLDATSAERVDKRVTAAEEQDRNGQLSVTYLIPDRTSLPSRADRQQVQIAAIPLEAEFYKLAAPALTEQVYDEARITNSSRIVLLPGPVSTYVQGRFVGYGDAPMVTGGESFVLGFGIDTALRCSRELVERSEQTQGGNRIVDLAYALRVQNFGDQAVWVRLTDRMPVVAGGDIKLTLDGEAERSLSDDPEYRRRDRPQGILRWDVSVAPGAVGGEALGQEYSFRLEYDRQMTLSGLGVQGG